MLGKGTVLARIGCKRIHNYNLSNGENLIDNQNIKDWPS